MIRAGPPLNKALKPSSWSMIQSVNIPIDRRHTKRTDFDKCVGETLVMSLTLLGLNLQSGLDYISRGRQVGRRHAPAREFRLAIRQQIAGTHTRWRPRQESP